MMSLGELYRELRMARGLKLKGVAGQRLSASQLSKFENGQSMLTADKLLVAISAIHMSFSEFGHALNHYGNQLANLQVAGDIEGLKEVLKNYEADENFDTYNRLTRIDIVSAIYALDPSYEIKEDDKQFLT